MNSNGYNGYNDYNGHNSHNVERDTFSELKINTDDNNLSHIILNIRNMSEQSNQSERSNESERSNHQPVDHRLLSLDRTNSHTDDDDDDDDDDDHDECDDDHDECDEDADTASYITYTDLIKM